MTVMGYCCQYVSASEHVQDKHIARDDELSDSEDEGDGRQNETSHPSAKRVRVSEDGETGKQSAIPPKSTDSNSAAAGGGNVGGVKSPVPPEPSPITPGPLPHAEEADSSENKSEFMSF